MSDTTKISDSEVVEATAPGHVHGPGCRHHHHDHPVSVPFVRAEAKVGRNDACPCGSGKKFKKCCQKAADSN